MLSNALQGNVEKLTSFNHGSPVCNILPPSFKISLYILFSAFWLWYTLVWFFMCLFFLELAWICSLMFIYFFKSLVENWQPLSLTTFLLFHCLLSFWNSNHIYIRLFDSVPEISEGSVPFFSFCVSIQLI